jgi:hypothetical protein
LQGLAETCWASFQCPRPPADGPGYAGGMTGGYLKAVAATLAAMRKIKAGDTVSA